ncbi:MAG: hypothetical protein H6Q96_232 [Nitrospirae bacterium]|nr:hypothetical protein [Nitrospirota bacterium]
MRPYGFCICGSDDSDRAVRELHFVPVGGPLLHRQTRPGIERDIVVPKFVEDQGKGLRGRDDDPLPVGLKVRSPFVPGHLYCFLLDPSFAITLARDRNAVTVLLFFQDADLVAEQDLGHDLRLGQGFFAHVGKGHGNKAEADLRRRLLCHGGAGRRRKGEQHDDQSFHHRVAGELRFQDNRMEEQKK